MQRKFDSMTSELPVKLLEDVLPDRGSKGEQINVHKSADTLSFLIEEGQPGPHNRKACRHLLIPVSLRHDIHRGSPGMCPEIRVISSPELLKATESNKSELLAIQTYQLISCPIF
jgi:hypothetical protein